MATLTDLTANRQGSALVLYLEDKALDAVAEIDDEDIAEGNGVDAVIEHLNRIFQKDSMITKYQALEVFETIERSVKENL